MISTLIDCVRCGLVAALNRGRFNEIAIKQMQQLAVDIGVLLKVDGKLGPLTVRWIRTFQGAYQYGEYETKPLTVNGLPDAATIRAAQMCRLAGLRVSRSFKFAEFITNGSRIVTLTNPVLLLDRRLVGSCQSMRDFYGVMVVIVSGFRSIPWNRRIGSSDTSQHPKGKAVDFYLIGATPTESVVRRWFDGVGIESDGRVSHADVRGYWARWFYRRMAALR